MSLEISTANSVSRILAIVMIVFAPNNQNKDWSTDEICDLRNIRGVNLSLNVSEISGILGDRSLRKCLKQHTVLWGGEVNILEAYKHNKHVYKVSFKKISKSTNSGVSQLNNNVYDLQASILKILEFKTNIVSPPKINKPALEVLDIDLVGNPDINGIVYPDIVIESLRAQLLQKDAQLLFKDTLIHEKVTKIKNGKTNIET